MEERKINRQKQNHQQGSSSYGGKKSSKKKPHNSVLRCRTNSNLTRKTGKARGRKDIRTLKRKVKALVEKMEAKVAKMRREREETLEIAAVAEDMKLELDLVKISIHQHSNDMLCISYAVDQLAEILLHLN